MIADMRFGFNNYDFLSMLEERAQAL